MQKDDPFWDDKFHGAAWAAYVDVMAETGQFPPDSETVKHRAYQYYEQEKCRG